MNTLHLIYQHIIRCNALVFFIYTNRCPLGWLKLPKPAFAHSGLTSSAIGQGSLSAGRTTLVERREDGGGRKEEKLFWRCDVCKESASFERAVQPLVIFASSYHPLHSLKCLSTLERPKTFAGSWQFLSRSFWPVN